MRFHCTHNIGFLRRRHLRHAVEDLLAESEQTRFEFQQLVRPFVISPTRYALFHAPDHLFTMPLPDFALTPPPYLFHHNHVLYPRYRPPVALVSRHVHFGRRLELRVPSAPLYARLLYMALSEVKPFEIPPDFPLDRADAMARGMCDVTRTQADLPQLNEHKSASFGLRNASDETAPSLSERWDHDWTRLFCIDPCVMPNAKRMPYTVGSLTGKWLGRSLVCTPAYHSVAHRSLRATDPNGAPVL